MHNLIFFYILSVPVLTFTFGFCGLIIWRKNFILMLVSLEICFMASNLGFVLWSFYIDDVFGLVFCLTGLAITGAEVALGLALAILLHRKKETIETTELDSLRS